MLPRPRRAAFRLSAVCLTAVLALTTASDVRAQAVADAATESNVRAGVDLLPPGVLLHVAAPNMNDFRDRLQNSPIYGLLTDDKLASIRNTILEKLRDVSEQMEGKAGFTIRDILDLPQGELSLSIVQPPGEDIAGVLMIDYGSNSETVEKILDLLEDIAVENGGEILSEEAGETELVTIIMEEEPEIPTEIASYNYFLRDKVWVMATNLDALEAVNDRWDSTSEATFSEDETFKEVMEQCDLGTGRKPMQMVYADPVGILTATIMAVSENIPQAQQAQMALGLFPLLGVNNLKAIGATSDFDPETGDSVSRLFTRLDRTGNPSIYDIFALASGDNTPPAFVADDVTGYSSFIWQPEKAYAAVENFVDMFAGGPGTLRAQLDQIANLPDGPNVHIKDDVLDQITGRFIVAADSTGRAEQTRQRQLISLELTKNSRLPEVIDEIIESQGADLESRDFRGTTIYQIEIPSQSVGGAQNNEKTTAGLAVAGGYVHFATEVSLIEQALRGVDNPLAASDRYADATDGFPRATMAIAVQDGAAQVQQVWELARSGTFDDATRELDIDLKELPSFDDVRQYFASSASYTTRTDRGVLTKSIGRFNK